MCYFEKDQLKYKLLCILFRQLLGNFWATFLIQLLVILAVTTTTLEKKFAI